MHQLKRFISASKPVVERFPKVASFYRYLRDYYSILRRLREQSNDMQCVTTPLGYKYVGLASGDWSMANGGWEKAETELFLQLLESVELVINVGANVGHYCCLALNSGKHVIAFEPIQSNLACLYQNIEMNGWSEHCEVFPVALGSAIGLLTMYGTGMGASSIRGWSGNSTVLRHVVPVFPIDTVLGERTRGKKCLVLVDVEGAEFQVLQGAIGLLNQDPKPVWLIEIHSRRSQPAGVDVNPFMLDTFRVFWQAGYQSFVADETVRKVNEHEVSANAQLVDSSLEGYDYLFLENGDLSSYGLP